MGKYDDAIGGGKIILDVEEVLNEEAAKKVDDKIKKQKVDLGKPIEVTLKSDRALQRLKELTSAAKQVKSELQEALSSKKSFEDINKLVSKYEVLKKQIKAVTPEVDKNNDALKESSKVLKDTKKFVDQLTVSQDKLNKTKRAKTNTSTKKEVELAKDLANAAENVAKTQEKAAKTTLRTQQQVNAELEKEQKALKDIEAQQAKNDAAREKFKKKQANYGQEVFGGSAPVYDTDLLKGAAEELKEFNQQLETRNKFQEKYNKLCRMVEKYYVSDEPGKYGIGAGDRYNNLDQFVELTSSMKELDALFVSGQKTTNKSINALFGNVVRDLQAQIKAATAMIESGDGFGDQVGQKLDVEERNLNKEMQRLEETRQAQLTKVNALRQEELDLIKKAGQEEAKVVAGQKQAKSKNNLKFADGTLLNEKQVAAVEKYCKVLKKVMGDAYNEAKTLHHALQLVFDISNGNVGNIIDRFTSGNSASNAVLKMLTGMEVNNQKNRDAALRSINPETYDKIIAESAEQARAKLAEEKTKFQREWDEFASVMLGGDAFENETKLVKGKILKEFAQYADTAADAIHALNKAWLSGELEGKSGKTKWVQAYIEHLDNQRDYIESIRDTKAGDIDIDSLFGLGGTTGLSEEKAKALRDEAAAWDELIAKKKEYYGIEIPQVIEAPKVDEDELEIIQKENGALEDKLELLQDIAEQYANTVTQRDRNRYEELNQKDMDGGLTPRQEERYWELGEAIDEADRQIEEFGETYSRVILKLANGKKIEILPEDAGLKKFDKIANEYYQGEYNGVEIVDVIFERVQRTNNALLEQEKVVKTTVNAQVEDNKKLVSSYEDLVDSVKKYIELAKQLKPISSPEYTKTQEALDYAGYVDSKDEAIAEIKAWYTNVQRIKASQKQGLSVYKHVYADGEEREFSVNENTLKKAQTTLNGYIYKAVDHFGYTVAEAINDFSAKRMRTFVEGQINKYLEIDAADDAYRVEAKAFNAPIEAAMEQISSVIMSAVNDADKSKAEDILDTLQSRANSVNRYTLSRETNNLGGYMGIITPDAEIQANAKKIESYEELCDIVARYHQLQRESVIYGGKNYPGLNEADEKELRELRARLTVTGGEDVWKLSDFGEFRDIDKLATALGVTIPSASGSAVEANKKLESSYEGLAEVIEKYVDASKRLWDAYDAQGDYSQAAKDRLSAVKQLLTYFPKNTISFGNSDHSADIYFESQEESRRYAEMGAEATLREVEARIALTRESQEQARLAREAAETTAAQVEAEEKLAAAAKKTTNAKKGQKGTSNKSQKEKDVFEDIIKKDLEDALEKLRSAKNNETTLFSLKGLFEGDDLVGEAEKTVKNIAKQANLTLAKFNVKDDTIKVKLYNDELKVTVDQMYKLKAATEEMESAQLALISQSFTQDVKALNANTFDVDGVQQRALAAIEKVRSSLHGLEYDLTGLEDTAKNISSQDDFVKFSNQLKAAQDNIQAIKNSTVSKNSMNPLVNMQRDMQNANIEIETMRLKLDKFGDIQGVSEAKNMLEEMAVAAKKYNEATDAQGQQSAYNQYSNLRSSFKAQTEYINAAKSLNDSQKSTQKQTDPIKQHYQTILDLVNKINTANERMIKFQQMDGGSGILGQQIANEQAKKLESIEKLNSVMEKLNVGNVLGGDKYTISDDIQSIGTDYSQITAFINDAGVQASLTTAEIEKLVKALQKAGDIDLSMISEALNASSIIEKAKKAAYENNYFKSNFGESSRVAINQDGSTDFKIGADKIEALGVAGSTAKEKLEALAQTIAKNSDGAVAMTKSFSQGADGIARLDFSIFDKNTNAMRNFTLELGTATQQFGIYETTVNKSAATMKAAEKQLMSMQATLRTLEAQGIGINADTAAPQVKKLLEMINALSAAMNSGKQGDILNTSKRAKIAQKDVERLQQQLVGLESAIENGSMTSLGVGNTNGNVYDQLVSQLPKLTKDYIGATVEVGAFDKATNTLNASVVHAGGAVEHFQLKMSALNGQMAYQKVGVSQLSTSWGVFKKEIMTAGRRLMTALVGYNVFYKAIAEVRKGIGYVKDIDLALTELKKVTDETEASYRKFLDTAASSARKVGSTVSDFTEATANFARLNI